MNTTSPRNRMALRDATLITGVVLVGVYAGSGSLAHFDDALAGYFVATIVATFATAVQVAAFWRRRPSAFYGRALARGICRPTLLLHALRSAARDLGAQRFIGRRDRFRWLAHILLSWGTLVGFAVTIPLVLGLFYFEPLNDHTYEARALLMPVAHFTTDGVIGWVVFHILDAAAVAVVLGTLYFLGARLRLHRDGNATSRFHVVPLLMLLAVALTGLALSVTGQSGPWWLFRTAACAHEAMVIAFLVTLPYGKLIHLFIRPLHVGVQLVRAASPRDVRCERCGLHMAPVAQGEAVEEMLAAHGFSFGLHTRRCPACRRRLLATAQARMLGAHFQPRPALRRASLREAA